MNADAGSEPVRFLVVGGLFVHGRGTIAAGRLEAGAVQVGDELEWVRGATSRRTLCLGVVALHEDPPTDHPLDGVVLDGFDPSDLAEGDLLRTPVGAPPTVAADGRTPLRTQLDPPGQTLFDRVGGRPFFDRVVARFYAGVDTDPVIRPLYPEDLTESIRHTAGFLAQYWGGGTAHYSDERGHPRLRMRHGHVAIGVAERDRWVHHMTEAVLAEELDPELERKLLDYFDHGATFLQNAET